MSRQIVVIGAKGIEALEEIKMLGAAGRRDQKRPFRGRHQGKRRMISGQPSTRFDNYSHLNRPFSR
jgi:hypothetical protein